MNELKTNDDVKDYTLRVERQKDAIDCQVQILKTIARVDEAIEKMESNPDCMKNSYVKVDDFLFDGRDQMNNVEQIPNDLFREMKQPLMEFLLSYRTKLINHLNAYEVKENGI